MLHPEPKSHDKTEEEPLETLWARMGISAAVTGPSSLLSAPTVSNPRFETREEPMRALPPVSPSREELTYEFTERGPQPPRLAAGRSSAPSSAERVASAAAPPFATATPLIATTTTSPASTVVVRAVPKARAAAYSSATVPPSASAKRKLPGSGLDEPQRDLPRAHPAPSGLDLLK